MLGGQKQQQLQQVQQRQSPSTQSTYKKGYISTATSSFLSSKFAQSSPSTLTHPVQLFIDKAKLEYFVSGFAGKRERQLREKVVADAQFLYHRLGDAVLTNSIGKSAICVFLACVSNKIPLLENPRVFKQASTLSTRAFDTALTSVRNLLSEELKAISAPTKSSSSALSMSVPAQSPTVTKKIRNTVLDVTPSTGVITAPVNIYSASISHQQEEHQRTQHPLPEPPQPTAPSENTDVGMDASSSSYAAVAAAVDVEPAPKQQQQCIVTKPAQQQQKRKRADGDMGLQMSGLAGRQSMVNYTDIKKRGEVYRKWKAQMLKKIKELRELKKDEEMGDDNEDEDVEDADIYIDADDHMDNDHVEINENSVVDVVSEIGENAVMEEEEEEELEIEF